MAGKAKVTIPEFYDNTGTIEEHATNTISVEEVPGESNPALVSIAVTSTPAMVSIYDLSEALTAMKKFIKTT